MSKNGWTLALFSVALLALVSASVSAETDVYASGVVQWEYLYNTNDDIESSVSDARVDLDIGVGPLTLGAVYRAYQLTDPAYNPAGKDIPAAEGRLFNRLESTGTLPSSTRTSTCERGTSSRLSVAGSPCAATRTRIWSTTPCSMASSSNTTPAFSD